MITFNYILLVFVVIGLLFMMTAKDNEIEGLKRRLKAQNEFNDFLVRENDDLLDQRTDLMTELGEREREVLMSRNYIGELEDDIEASWGGQG